MDDLSRLAVVSQRLTELDIPHACIGGATIPLFITEPQFVEVRPTLDVDVVLPTEVYRAFEPRMEEVGFKHLPESGVVCRRSFGDIAVDLMPDDAAVFGFAGTWYPEVLASSWTMKSTAGPIRLTGVCELFATKLEAAFDRGSNDFRLSHDLEDLIAILNGRKRFPEEIRHLENLELQSFVAQHLRTLSELRNWETEILPCHLGALARNRVPFVQDRIQKIISCGEQTE